MTPELARLIAALVSIHACMASLRMAAPLWALRQDYSEFWVGCLLAAFALTQVFLAVAAGRYADRRGLRAPVGLSVVVAVVGTLPAAVWPSFATLCVAALCSGAATGAAVIALQRHVGRAASGDPARIRVVFSWLAVGPALSNFVGPFTAGLLIDGLGFRAAFLASALWPLAAWWGVRRTVELPPVVPSAGGQGPAWHLMKEPRFARLMFVNWTLSSCWDVHTFLVPVIGVERGLSASTIGALLGAFAVAATAVRMALPAVAGQLREGVVLMAAMLATALLFGLYPLAPGALTMGALSVLLGVALGSVQPMIMSTLHHITPEAQHGQALGLRVMVINASSVTMPILFGTVGAALGAAAVFWGVGLLVGGAARVGWTLGERGRSTDSPRSPD
jgi:MFS family permease